MRYSNLLNGFWEEGYHYYLEFEDESLTVRNYRREVVFTTKVSYDRKALEAGERTVIHLDYNVLSKDASGNRMMEIRELAYEDGELDLLEYYTIMGEKHYRLKKVDHGPFDHILIRDEEILPKIQGVWKEWSPSGRGQDLVIRGNELKWGFFGGGRFHAVSYKYAPDKVRLVPENLIDGNFPGFTEIEVEEEMLTTRMIICDASTPLTVFARADRIDKIEIPPAAKEPIRNTMIYEGPLRPFSGGPMTDVPPVKMKEAGKDLPKDPETGYALVCPGCGYQTDGKTKFCPECGSKLY